MNRRGQAEQMIENIPYLILTVLVMVGLYFLLSYYSSTTINVEKIQVSTFLYRELYQPNGLSYTDNLTGKVYPGLIDAKDFTNEHLDASMHFNYDKQIMAKFEIYDQKYNQLQATAYYNGVWYSRMEPLALSFLPGIGGANYYSKTVPIIFRRGVQSIPAMMEVTVIVPR